MIAIRNITVISLVCGLQLTCIRAVRMLAPLYMVSHHYSAGTIGLFVALFPLSSVFLALPAGAWTDRVGSRRMLVIAALLGVMSGLALPVFPNMLGAALLQVTSGLAHLLTMTAGQYAATSSQEESTGGAVSQFFFLSGFSELAGPLMGGILKDAAGFLPALVAAAVVSGVSLVGLIVVRSEGAGYTANRQDARTLSRSVLLRLAMACAFANAFTLVLKDSFLPIYLSERGLSGQGVGLLLAVSSGTILFSRGLLGPLSRRLGYRRLLAGSQVLGAVALLAMPLYPVHWWLGLTCAVQGLSWGLSQPLTTTLTAMASGPSLRGLALGMRLTVNRVGIGIGSLAFGSAASTFGTVGTFPVAAGVLMMAGLYLNLSRDVVE